MLNFLDLVPVWKSPGVIPALQSPVMTTTLEDSSSRQHNLDSNRFYNTESSFLQTINTSFLLAHIPTESVIFAQTFPEK
jgi:hypothetical protein